MTGTTTNIQRRNKNATQLLVKKDVDPLIYLYFEINNLKELYRRGWLLRGISQTKCESIADHLFGQSILTLFIAERYFPELNITKLLKMSLIHELGEIYIGDMTPKDHIDKLLKYQLELKAVTEVFSKIPRGPEYIALWKEYEEGITAEAIFVREVDVLEAAFQGASYQLQYPKQYNENEIPAQYKMIDWTRKRLKNKKLIQLIDELKMILEHSKS